MPALPSVTGLVRVNMPFAISGAPNALNRLYFHYSGTSPTVAQLSTFCDSVASAWNTNLKALTASQVILEPVSAEDLSSTTAAIATGTTSVTGTNGHALPSAASSMVVNFHIDRRYRGGKPKVFTLQGTAFDLADANTWGSSVIGAMATDWLAFITAICAAGWTAAGTIQHWNVSYYHGFTVVTNPVTGRARNVPTLRATPLTDLIRSYSVNPTIGSQRRRNGMR